MEPWRVLFSFSMEYKNNNNCLPIFKPIHMFIGVQAICQKEEFHIIHQRI